MSLLKTLSCWAKRHPWFSRFAITLIHINLTFIALFWSSNFFTIGSFISNIILVLAISTFLLSWLFYPTNSSIKHYKKQKRLDIILITTTMLMVFSLGNLFLLNQDEQVQIQPSHQTIQFVSYTHTIKSQPPQTSLKSQINALKNNLKSIKRSIKSAIKQKKKQKTTVGEIALIVFSILIAAGLILLLTALSCSVACSGAEGAAIVLLISGITLITFLTVKVIKAILKKNGGERLDETLDS